MMETRACEDEGGGIGEIPPVCVQSRRREGYEDEDEGL